MRFHKYAAAILLAFCATVCAATLEVQPNGYRVVLENEFMRAFVDAHNGGRITNLNVFPDLVDWIPDGKWGGLFADHLWGQPMPGELMASPYEMAILERGPDVVSVRLSRMTQGKSGSEEPNPLQSKMLLEKTYALKKGNPGLFCHIKVTNTDERGKLLSYWQQHIVFPKGEADPEETVMIRPSRRGVRVSTREDREDYIHDVMAGWTAILDRKRKVGMAFLLDYDDLGFLYNALSVSTTEWVAEDAYLPAGKTWETDTVALPLKGFSSLQHASRRFLADLDIKRQGDRIAVQYTVARAVEPVEMLRLGGEIYSVTDKKSGPLPDISVKKLTVEPRTAIIEATAPGKDPLVFRIRAVSEGDGRQVAESFETFYVGNYGWGDNITMDMVTPVYVAEAPQKKRDFQRPDKLHHPLTNEYYLIQGLMTDRWRLDQLWLQMVPWSTYERSFYKASRSGAKIEDFPYDYEKLLRKAVVILCNAKVSATGPVGMAMLRDYVAAGGALWIFGGHVAYGAAAWKDSPLEEVLPVKTTGKPFDVRRAKDTLLRPGPNPGGLLLDVDLSAAPRCYYYHTVEPKPGSHVVLTVDGGKPFLVVGQYEKGYVVCFCGTPIGEPASGELPFWNWDGWATVLYNAFLWSTGGQAALR